MMGKKTNTGGCNTGDWNIGDWNIGDWNIGNRNAGNRNIGDGNIGDGNSGDGNIGNRNAGNWNDGYKNIGDWNIGNYNIGYFNIDQQETVTIFGKETHLDIWLKYHLPNFLFFRVTKWIREEDMTEKEKEDNPSYKTTGGYLKCLGYKEAFKESWDNADPIDRERIRECPNFDADIFYEISGIDLRNTEKTNEDNE